MKVYVVIRYDFDGTSKVIGVSSSETKALALKDRLDEALRGNGDNLAFVFHDYHPWTVDHNVDVKTVS